MYVPVFTVITVRMIVQMLISLNNSITEYANILQEIFNKHPDKNIFASFPGAGDALAPRLPAHGGLTDNALSLPKIC